MLKAVIFDMDGTLGDTLALILRCFKETIEPILGRTVSDDELMATFGPSEEATINALIPEHFDEGMSTYHRLYQMYHSEYPKPFDGIPEILRYIKEKNRRLGLVTGKGPAGTQITLRMYGMQNMFDAIETGIPEKPNKPACLRRMLDKFGIAPDEAVYVGDAPSDIPAARGPARPSRKSSRR